MNPGELVAQLMGQGARLWCEGGELRCRAPRGVLTPELRTELAAHKGEILEWLRRAPARVQISAAQEGMWFSEQLEPGIPAYNVPHVVRMSGPVDVEAVEQSVNDVIRRHDALRTTITAVDGQPLQVVAPDLWLPVPLVDLSGLPDAERQAETARLEADHARRPFDLERGPLLRASLLRLGGEHGEHRFLLTVHHLVWDLWSMSIFLRELVAGYDARRNNRPPRLPPVPAQYADFVTWQHHFLQSPAAEAQLQYWRGRLSGSSAVLELPTDRPRHPARTHRGDWHGFRLAPDLVQRLEALGRSEGVTLYMIVLAALQTLMHRYSGQRRVRIGTPTAGRQHAEFAGVIGLFAHFLVLDTDLSGDPTCRTLLRRVRDVALGAYAHQDVPFARLVAELQPERNSGRPAAPEAVLVFDQDMLSPVLHGSGMETLPLLGFRWTARAGSGLALFVIDSGQGLRCGWSYSPDFFDHETIVRMTGHFQTLLEGFASDPDRTIALLPLVTGPERDQVLGSGAEAAAERAALPCLHDLFAAQAVRTPDAVAVIAQQESVTYGDLDRRANQLAQYLRRRGVGPEVPVGLCLERSADLAVGLLGILKAGGAYVPLDPTYPRERLAFMQQDANLSILVTWRRFAGVFAGSGAAVVCLDADRPVIAREDSVAPAGSSDPDHLFSIVYTSGSTGLPNGVMIPHRSVSNFVLWMQDAFPINAEDVLLQKTPFTFDISVWELCAAWLVGATVVMARPEGQCDASYLVKTIRGHGVTQLHVVPALLQALVEEPVFEACRSLRRIYSAEEALPRALVARVRSLLDVAVINLYGPTEGNVDTYWVAGPPVDGDTVPIGRPIANTHVYVLDEHLQPAPIGVPGELYVGGAGLARGYLRRPELTAERFIRHPFSADPRARLYKTGDRGRYLASGNLEFLGRLDEQIKLRGFRIEPGEIEAALKEHPAVRDAAVVLRESAAGDKRLVAFVVSCDASSVPEDDLRRSLRAKLPGHMMPSVILPIETLPLTASGKVDRRNLPPDDVVSPPRKYVKPASPTEAQLVHIWEALLGVHPIGVADNFFELGGHSLLAARLVAAVEQELGKRLPLSALVEEATVKHAAEVLLRRESGHIDVPTTAIHPDGARPPFFFLHGDYAGGGFYCHRLARVLGPDQPLVALHPHGLDGGLVPCSIEDMAAEQLRRIRAIRAHGPYQLGGYCNGGQVAFETARRLRAQGEHVTLLFLVESSVLNAALALRAAAMLARGLGGLRGRGAETQVRLVGALRRAMYEWPRLPAHHRRRIAWFVIQQRPEQARAVRRRARRVRDAFTAPFHRASVNLHGLDNVDKAHLRALLGYVPAPYGGPITVVRAADSRDPRPDLGWRGVTDEIAAYTVPGDHLTCVAQHVADVGSCLAACLKAAQ